MNYPIQDVNQWKMNLYILAKNSEMSFFVYHLKLKHKNKNARIKISRGKNYENTRIKRTY